MAVTGPLDPYSSSGYLMAMDSEGVPLPVAGENLPPKPRTGRIRGRRQAQRSRTYMGKEPVRWEATLPARKTDPSGHPSGHYEIVQPLSRWADKFHLARLGEKRTACGLEHRTLSSGTLKPGFKLAGTTFVMFENQLGRATTDNVFCSKCLTAAYGLPHHLNRRQR